MGIIIGRISLFSFKICQLWTICFQKKSFAKNPGIVHSPFFSCCQVVKIHDKKPKKKNLAWKHKLVCFLQYKIIWNSKNVKLISLQYFFLFYFKCMFEFILIFWKSTYFEIRVMSLQLKLNALQNQWKVYKF